MSSIAMMGGEGPPTGKAQPPTSTSGTPYLYTIGQTIMEHTPSMPQPNILLKEISFPRNT